jgi:hypothetical protein
MRGSSRKTLLGTALVLGLILTAPSPAVAAPPVNDDFDGAVAFGAVPFEATEDTTEATEAADDPDPSCVPEPVTHTVWYSVTLAATTEIAVDTSGSDYDTVLSAWTGPRGALDEVACNDDSGGLQSRIRFTAAAGVTYHLLVGAFPGSPPGTLVLHGQALPPQVTLAVTIGATGSVGNGAAGLHGTVSCSRPVDLTVAGTLRQQQGRRVVVGSYRTALSCSGTTTWEATALGETGTFRRGPARVVAVAEFVDVVRAEVIRARADRTVRLD